MSFKDARQKVNSMFIRPGETYASVIAKNKLITSKSPVNKSHATNLNQNRPLSNKRRLSGEKEENPSSKIHLSNVFSLLDDEMEIQRCSSSSGPPASQIEHANSAPIIHQDRSVGRAEASVSVFDLVRDGTSVLVGDPVQPGTSVSVRDPVRMETSASVCVPALAGTSPSSSTSVRTKNLDVTYNPEKKITSGIYP